MKSLRSSTPIRKPARTLAGIPAEATVLPPAQAGSPSVGGGPAVHHAARVRRAGCPVSLRWRSAWAHPPAGAVPAKH